MSRKVLIPLAFGFEEIEAISVADILRRAKVDVVLAGLTTVQVQGAHGICVVADALLSELDGDTFDMIVLPGGLPGALNLAQDAHLQALLKTFDTQGKFIAAICAAPYALKSAGVLKNNYTCYPSFETKIDHDGYTSTQKIVCDENIITSQGPSTAMLFTLKLVEILCGDDVAQQLKKDLLIIR